jgi:hypothetical protein
MAIVMAMIKFEKMHKLQKAARMIQYRCSQFTCLFAQWILPYEKAVYRLRLDRPHLRTFAKGRNNAERASDLRKFYEEYSNPVIYEADHASFDSCVSPYHLRWTHKLYRSAFSRSELLRTLCKSQLRNRGYTRGGIRYTTYGKRMSGDADTALGNSLVNYATLKYIFGPDSLVYCDGDDSVVFLPRDVAPKLHGTGFDTVINKVTSFENIEFCQSRPLLTPEGWIMARNPLRAMTRMGVSCGKVVNVDYATTIGIGEIKAQPYVPGVYDLALAMSQLGGKYQHNMLEYQTKIGRVNWLGGPAEAYQWATCIENSKYYLHPCVTQNYVFTNMYPKLMGGCRDIDLAMNKSDCKNVSIQAKSVNVKGTNLVEQNGKRRNRRRGKHNKATIIQPPRGIQTGLAGLTPMSTTGRVKLPLEGTEMFSQQSIAFIKNYCDPLGEHNTSVDAARVPDGALNSSAGGFFRGITTVVLPWQSGTVTLEGTYSLLIVQPNFVRSMAILIGRPTSEEFDEDFIAKFADKWAMLPSREVALYPNWVEIDDTAGSVFSVLQTGAMQNILPPDSNGVSGTIDSLRFSSQGISMFYNTPDLINQGTYASMRYPANFSLRDFGVQQDLSGYGPMYINTRMIGSVNEISVVSSGSIVPTLQWNYVANPNFPVTPITATHAFRNHSGSFVVDVGDEYRFEVGINAELVNLTTTQRISVCVTPSTAVNTYNSVRMYTIWDGDDTPQAQDTTQTVLVFPPSTQADMYQQNPKSDIQLSKETGGVYLPGAIFQPIFNVAQSGDYRKILFTNTAHVIRPDEIDTETGWFDTLDRNFGISIINMQSVPYACKPMLKYARSVEIVPAANSLVGIFTTGTPPEQNEAVDICKSFTDNQPHGYPETYNGLGVLFGKVLQVCQAIPTLVRSGLNISRAVKKVCDDESVQEGLRQIRHTTSRLRTV